jgi:hypothetical protein
MVTGATVPYTGLDPTALWLDHTLFAVDVSRIRLSSESASYTLLQLFGETTAGEFERVAEPRISFAKFTYFPFLPAAGPGSPPVRGCPHIRLLVSARATSRPLQRARGKESHREWPSM